MDNTGILIAAVKAMESESPNGEFEAIISTPSQDRKGQVVEPHALDPLPKSVPIFHQHDWREKALPVGRGTPYYEGDVLKMKGYFASSPRAQEIRSLVNEGVMDAMSVAFLYKPANVKALGDGGETVTKGELIETSFTATPVNPTALVLASKALAEKAGARHSATDREHIETLAGVLAALGWECPACASAAETKSNEDASDTDPVVDAGAEQAPAEPPAEVDEAALKEARLALALHSYAAGG